MRTVRIQSDDLMAMSAIMQAARAAGFEVVHRDLVNKGAFLEAVIELRGQAHIDHRAVLRADIEFLSKGLRNGDAE